MLHRLLRLFRKSSPSSFGGLAHIWAGPYGIYVCAVHQAVTGFTFESEPRVLLSSDVNLLGIGEAVLNALRQFRDQQPDELADSARKRTPQDLGYPTWRKFERVSRFITIVMSADRTQVELHRLRRRTRGGFIGTKDCAADATCPAEAVALGNTVHELLSLDLPDYTKD